MYVLALETSLFSKCYDDMPICPSPVCPMPPIQVAHLMLLIAN